MLRDFAMPPDANRAISTAFGPPALCGGGIDPTCLGDEVAVWDVEQEKVIQTADLGTNSGALMVRFDNASGVRRAYINTPGTSAVWLADDDVGRRCRTDQQVLGPDDGLLIPADILLSYDSRYLYVTNWFGDTVNQFDISGHSSRCSTRRCRFRTRTCCGSPTTSVYTLTNSLLTTWDNDTRFGPARNGDYGLWRFDVEPATGKLTSFTPDGAHGSTSRTSRRRRQPGRPART